MSDEKKLTLGARAPLGLKKTVDAGNVKQTFSHGRSNTVAVEVKKRRNLKPQGGHEVEVEPVPAPAPVVAPAPPLPQAPVRVVVQPLEQPIRSRGVPPTITSPKPEVPAMVPEPEPEPVPESAPEPVAEIAPPPAAPTPATPATPAAPARTAARPAAPPPRQAPAPQPRRPMATDRLSRQEALQAQLRLVEEERMVALEEARRRMEQGRIDAQEAEKLAREAKRKAEEDSAAAEQAQAQVAAAQAAQAAQPKPATSDAQPASRTERPRPTSAVPDAAKRKVEVAKPSRTRGDERRTTGKLTVHKVLDGEDGGRVRSMAALKRAREKEKRLNQGAQTQVKQAREVVVPESITVQDLANRMAERANDVIKALFKMGVIAKLTETIDPDTAELIVTEFGHTIKRVAESDVEIGVIGEQDIEEALQSRPPVVTIMGHVDHGKTSLLDALRGTDIVAGEAGGITQHIGAYQVTLKSGDRITFLDTPGHAAFSQMRARGANVTDIVVLVVAADDGIMPQTIEAINHARAANVPMIVAINKCDKPDAQPDRIREALLQHNVQVEKYGGEVQDVMVSALKKTGLEDLTEKITLQAEILELKSNPDRSAEGNVIESKLDKGRGPVATVLVRRGTLKVGDIFVVGMEWGKVRALIDDKGRQVKQAGPTVPVEVLGLTGVPAAGDELSVVADEARAREITEYRQGIAARKRTTAAPATLESMFSSLRADRAKEFPIILKGDVHGSVEAIASAIGQLSTSEIKARVLHSGVGGITESDVALAKASNAPIFGFNVRANAKAREVAEREGVALKYYDIIYNLIDDIKAGMAGHLGPEVFENVVGRATVRDVFQAGKAGKAAGCFVNDGFIRRNLKARILRDDVIVYTGQITNLRRFKDDVTEVRSGLECGMTFEGFTELKQNDIVEVFQLEERTRTL